MSDNVLSSGLWDGVFYDNAWSNPDWLEGGDVDLDQDGRADGEEHGREWIATTWNADIVRLFDRTRELAGDDIVMMGNGSAALFAKVLIEPSKAARSNEKRERISPRLVRAK